MGRSEARLLVLLECVHQKNNELYELDRIGNN